MDGVSGSKTLGAVLIATAAAAGSSIYKVMFKKVMGEVSFGQESVLCLIGCTLLSHLNISGFSVLHHHWYHKHCVTVACGDATLRHWCR